MEPNQSQPTSQTPEPSVTPKAPPTGGQMIIGKIKTIGINLGKRFYANKKVFWPVTIAFGLILLMLIIGLVFGSRNKEVKPLPTITPTPFIQATPIPSPKAPELQSAGDRLMDLRQKIDIWDPKQSELRPLNYNFEVRF